VVAGWDLEAKVPDDWLTTVYAGNADRMWQPHFLVFLDLRHIDVDQFEMVYVGQVLLVSLKNRGTTERLWLKVRFLTKYGRFMDS
jgi:hypothetical protein